MQTSMGNTLEVKDLSIKEIQISAGEDLIDQDPSPPRPTLKKGRQEMEVDLSPGDGLVEESIQPRGQPRVCVEKFIAQ